MNIKELTLEQLEDKKQSIEDIYYEGMGCHCMARHQGDCACDDVDWTPKEVYELRKRIAEMEDLAQMIIDAESADGYARLAMYYSWLHRAKQLKEQGE